MERPKEKKKEKKKEKEKRKKKKNWTVKINHGSEIPREIAVFSYKSHLLD